MIKIGTDCSGIEAPIEALEQLGIEYEHIFSSEIDKFAIQSLKANYSPGILYGDITKRNVAEVPYVDLYVAGFPCQPFSTAGHLRGFADQRSGVFFTCLNYIRTQRPKHFILENVKNILRTDFFKVVQTELDSLREQGYNIDLAVLKTSDYGIPQNRERLFIVGSRVRSVSLKFETLPMMPVIDFVDQTNNDVEYNSIYENIKDIINPDAVFINLSFPYKRKYSLSHIRSCTITTGGTYWNCVKHRRASVRELLALQGFRPSFRQVVSYRQMLKQIGNSMSVNVLKVIIKYILKE